MPIEFLQKIIYNFRFIDSYDTEKNKTNFTGTTIGYKSHGRRTT